MDKYEVVDNDIGSGNTAVAKLMRHKETQELVAMKHIARGSKIDENIAREIVIHRSLRHPNIIGFKDVILTPKELVIVMEYAAGGNLHARLRTLGRFSEDEARYFFQQLISGVSYCHALGICHGDLNLENALLYGKAGSSTSSDDAFRLKICDFGCSKSSLLHSVPRSFAAIAEKTSYIAPEVLSGREYDGMLADVWACGVALYALLVNAFPFSDNEDLLNVKKTTERIRAVQYEFPDYVYVSEDCKDLVSRIFVANPSDRISIKEIKNHPWFLRNLPPELTESAQSIYYQAKPFDDSLDSVDNIMKIVGEAKTLHEDVEAKDENAGAAGAARSEDRKQVEEVDAMVNSMRLEE